ncbi:MAG: CBS domain-containing protein [Deltaproteobacteria bacterium]|nr:MAG: CBS domain-containing protein [Deltaproteobacteria bacterium]
MFVKRRMTKKVITIGKDEPLLEAKMRMNRRRVNQLPVMDGDKLVGIISKRDIQSATIPLIMLGEETEKKIRQILETTPVEKIMVKNPVTAHVTDTLEDAVILMHDHRVNSLPVLDNEGKLVGIITKTDILEAFMEALGVNEVSQRLEVIVEDRPGALAEVVNTIKEFNVNLISVMTTPLKEKKKRVVYLRVATLNVIPIKKALSQKGIYVLEAWEEE